MKLTAAQLDAIIPRKSYPAPRDQILKAINTACGKFGIQTPLRIAMYLETGKEAGIADSSTEEGRGNFATLAGQS